MSKTLRPTETKMGGRAERPRDSWPDEGFPLIASADVRLYVWICYENRNYIRMDKWGRTALGCNIIVHEHRCCIIIAVLLD